MSAIRQTNHYFRFVSLVLFVLLIAFSATIAAILFSWSMAVLLAAALIALLAVPALLGSMESRLALFFVLYAVSEFFKKATFLIDGQQLWSQFVVFLLPFGLFLLGVFIPWVRQTNLRKLTVLQWLVIGFVAIALANTWLGAGSSFIAKAAATGLLVLPLLMIAVASQYPSSLGPVATALVATALLSAGYGVAQFILGPTAIELRWAAETGRLSIGATHLIEVLEGVSYAFIWRITGFQPDEFTFAMFMMTGLACAWVLRVKGTLSSLVFLLISSVLILAIALSLVRTMWVATAIMIAVGILISRFPKMAKAHLLVPAFAVLFFAADIASSFLHRFESMAALANNPFLRRAITFGTLDARVGAPQAFATHLPNHWLGGFGYSASPWISQKFDGFGDLQINFGFHNAPLEFLLYVGIPGLLFFFAILWAALSQGYRETLRGQMTVPILAVLVAFVTAMYLTGLSNGGVFLSFPFFFFLGILSSKKNASISDWPKQTGLNFRSIGCSVEPTTDCPNR